MNPENIPQQPVVYYQYPAAPAPGAVVIRAPPPRDYVVWSLFSAIYMNCCFLGFAALVFSFKSRDCKVMGDPEGAAKNGNKAKYLNIAALIMGIISFIVFLVMLAISASFLHQQLQTFANNFHEATMEP